jgi:phage recombination protein Bet
MAIDSKSLALTDPTEELDIFKKHFAPANTPNDAWQIFIEKCRTYRLSPMRGQMCLVGRYDSNQKKTVYTPQITIGGLRALALRTGQFEGTTEPEWGDEEGNFYKLWPKKLGKHPYAARIGVYRNGFRVPVWGVAYFDEKAQYKSQNSGGGLTHFWEKMGKLMLLKCALADALRGAFEEECGGLYLHEEMLQADSEKTVITIVPEVESNEENEALKQTASRVQKVEVVTNSDPAPINAGQIKTIQMLQAKMGKPELGTDGLTSEDAKAVITQLNADLREYNQAKASKPVQPVQKEQPAAPKQEEPDLTKALKVRMNAALDRAKVLNQFEVVEGDAVKNVAAFLKFASSILNANVTHTSHLTPSRLDTIEKYLDAKDAA